MLECMLAQREDLLSWVISFFNCYQTKFQILKGNIGFSARF